jgi:HD-GYP domain-containing protein (c-di-GMP phosphodiesterase class II)
VLLRKGFDLNDASIDRLRQMRIPEAWIEYPGVEFIAEHVSPGALQERNKLAQVVREIFERMRGSGIEQEYANFREVVRGLCEALAQNPKACNYSQALILNGCPIARHSAEVCYLSLLMGLRLDAYLVSERERLSSRRAKDVSGLGVGAILHDVGMIDDRGRCDYQDGDFADDDPLLGEDEDHILRGYDMLSGVVDPCAASAVLHHHQRMDGSGLPSRSVIWPNRELGQAGDRGLEGAEAHVYARIIGAADAFDRMRMRGGPDATPVAAPIVLHRMMHGEMGHKLDPMVMLALLTAAPPFPLGVMVRLSDGREAIVAGRNGEQPSKPKVRTLPPSWSTKTADADQGEEIDLSESPALGIVESEGQDVTGTEIDVSDLKLQLKNVIAA